MEKKFPFLEILDSHDRHWNNKGEKYWQGRISLICDLATKAVRHFKDEVSSMEQKISTTSDANQWEQKTTNSKNTRWNESAWMRAITIFAIFTLVGGGFYVWKSETLNALRPVGLGLNTCFFRVNQTFTARMINDSASKYLGNEFVTDTENCFADLTKMGQATSDKIIGQLNSLAALTHQFHSALNNSKSAFTRREGETEGAIPSYKKLESQKFEVESSLEREAFQIEKLIDWLRPGLILGILVLAFGSIVEARKRKTVIVQALNNNTTSSPKVATTVFTDSQIATTQSVPKIDTVVVDRKILPAGVVTGAIEDTTTRSQIGDDQQLELEMTTEIGTTMPEYRPTSQLISTEDFNIAETIKIEDIISTCLEQMAPQFFSEGIAVDLAINPDTQVNEEQREILEQLFFGAINTAIKAVRPCERVTIAADGLNGEIHFNVTAYHPHDFKQESSIHGPTLLAEVSRRNQVIKVVSGDLKLEYRDDILVSNDGSVMGVKTELSGTPIIPNTLAMTEKDSERENKTARLVAVKKTTKRQLRRELES